MNGDSYNIIVAEGGFIVHVSRVSDQSATGSQYVPRVFPDSSALMNFLHNELLRSN